MIKYNIENHLPEKLYNNNSSRYLVQGWIFGISDISELYISLDSQKFYFKEYNIFRPDVAINNNFKQNSFFSGFTVPIEINSGFQEGLYQVRLTAKFKNGELLDEEISKVKIEPFKSYEDISFFNKADVVICMATYNPKIERFIKQIDSIRKQTYKNWICIISDDGSNKSIVNEIKNVIKNDNRFIFVEHEDNVGFYYNFERCLSLVPSFAKYVALSDQDDFWYPQKIEKCLNRFDDEVQLVYSDMKIVNENQDIIHDTYWVNRKNYYNSNDVDLLTIANTVTGAASVFRADLLKEILPFPHQYGLVFHDQWIAIIAALKGRIDYVDEPLYDYIQSGENVIGHSDFEKKSNFGILLDYISKNKEQNKQNLKYIYSFKHKNGQHILTLAENALLRLKTNTKEKKILKRVLTVKGLIKTSLKVLLKKHTLNNLEIVLLLSYITNKFTDIFSKPLSWLLVRRYNKKQLSYQSLVNNKQQPVDSSLLEYKRKFSGRNFIVSDQKKRVNVLLSIIDSKNFFGGYIGMFNFAKKIYELGYNVRILVTDQNEIASQELKKIQEHDESLKAFISNVEIDTCFSKNDNTFISPNDIFVATSWWTAHIANEAIKYTVKDKFIYLSQDYEPIFYEHGGYRVLAEESYKLNFVPLFSTEILQKYFIENKIIDDMNKGEYFNNPILDFQLTNVNEKVKQKKKLLYYARPQPHNARNLYPIGLLAIDRAIENGTFTDDEWEIIGIGGDIGTQILPSGRKVNHIGKFDMQKYKKVLPEHDIGLSLMDSPHPSLLPIEMASAGMLVVTNTYGIKNQEYFSNISTNILATEPYINSLAEALMEQEKKVNFTKERYVGSKVNWPHNWDEALNVEKVRRIFSKIDI